MSADFNQMNPLNRFVAEASDGMSAIARVLNPSGTRLPALQQLQACAITAHRIRWAAASYGFEGIAALSARLEVICEHGAEIPAEDWPRAVSAMCETVQGAQTLLNAIQSGRGEDQATVDRCLALSQGWAARQGPSAGRVPLESDTGHLSALPDEYILPQIDLEVMAYFLPEARQYLESLEANLLQLDTHPENKDLIQQLFRTAHTLKGSAYTVGFQAIGDLVHHVEDYLGAVRDQGLQVLPGHTDVVLGSIDVIRMLLQKDAEAIQVTRRRFHSVLLELKRLQLEDAADAAMAHGPAGTVLSWAEPHPNLEAGQGAGSARLEGQLGDKREGGRASHTRFEHLMNFVGELMIGRGRLEQRLLAMEQSAEQVAACKTRLIETVKSFADAHAVTPRTAQPAETEPATLTSRGPGDFCRLESANDERFNILGRQIGEASADISEPMAQLRSEFRHAHDELNQLQHVTHNMWSEIARIRMIPIGTPFARFRRTIRDVARASNKAVTLVISGEDTRVDTGVVERLVDALVHLVRNAVFHGIELPADRAAKGKPETGTIHLHAAYRGSSIVVEVEDDGAGIDLVKIREKAVTMGLATSEQIGRMTDTEALRFIFAPGFSTADTIGGQAGRGVGLDVVKQVVDSMNGHIEVESLPNVGTKFRLDLPLTALITNALFVRAGTERYAIGLSSIREVTMAAGKSLTKTEGRTLLSFGGEKIEVQSLPDLLRGESRGIDSRSPVVIVRTAKGPMGLAVDELLGRREIVIQRLEALRPLEQSYFGGTTIDPHGRVIVVLDLSRLGNKPADEPSTQIIGREKPSQEGTAGTTEVPNAAETAILLIDDSLTIRTFIGKLLESAGYSVDTAVDGEEGLRKASATRYRLIITDLELPKFNGYQVVQALRRRSLTKQIPIVVMTTKAGEQHRQSSVEIGVNAYVAKPVDERTLFQVVEQWVGRTPAVRT